MPKVLERRELAERVLSFWIDAPRVARRRKPGQFVMVRVREGGERFPLTIADADTTRGAVRLVVQVVGRSTQLMADLAEGGELLDLVGPLGKPTDIEHFGTVAMVCGGIGVAPSYPIAQALKEAGNRVVSIVGARTASLLIMLEEMAHVSDEVVVATEDGSAGYHGRVTDVLAPMLPVDRVVAIGPTRMMEAVANLTRSAAVPTIASLNPVMVDGTGMCGGCRVTVGGKNQFVCVDGPEFDAHQVDFPALIARMAAYRDQEHESLCRMGCA